MGFISRASSPTPTNLTGKTAEDFGSNPDTPFPLSSSTNRDKEDIVKPTRDDVEKSVRTFDEKVAKRDKAENWSINPETEFPALINKYDLGGLQVPSRYTSNELLEINSGIARKYDELLEENASLQPKPKQSFSESFNQHWGSLKNDPLGTMKGYGNNTWAYMKENPWKSLGYGAAAFTGLTLFGVAVDQGRQLKSNGNGGSSDTSATGTSTSSAATSTTGTSSYSPPTPSPSGGGGAGGGGGMPY